MILIDANILMYTVGAAHPCKAPSDAFMERVAQGKVEAAIDAETLQEILHRYRSLKRWDEGGRVYDATRRMIPHVIPITPEIMDEARSLLDRHPTLMSRDAVHAAVCRQSGADALCSYDRDFDAIPGLRRLEPHQVP